MAKKTLHDSDFESFEAESFDSGLAAAKMPVDVKGGKVPLTDYLSIPVHLIEEFSLKNGSDFSRASGPYFDSLVASMKETGVIEAVTLRPKSNGKYELLAGETRWMAAKAAGLRSIPAHIRDVDDKEARRIFSLTNLLRRDLTMRDRINGWWHYYVSAKEDDALAALRGDAESGALSEYAPNGEKISYRQIMRYVNLHDLPSEWIDLMEVNPETGKTIISIKAGIQILKLSAPQQADILPFAPKLNEERLKELVKLSDGELKDKEGNVHEWTTENVSRLANGEDLNSEKKESDAGGITIEFQVRRLNRMKTKIMNVAKTSLRVEDYERAPEVIKEALTLYYSQHG